MRSLLSVPWPWPWRGHTLLDNYIGTVTIVLQTESKSCGISFFRPHFETLEKIYMDKTRIKALANRICWTSLQDMTNETDDCAEIKQRYFTLRTKSVFFLSNSDIRKYYRLYRLARQFRDPSAPRKWNKLGFDKPRRPTHNKLSNFSNWRNLRLRQLSLPNYARRNYSNNGQLDCYKYQIADSSRPIGSTALSFRHKQTRCISPR